MRSTSTQGLARTSIGYQALEDARRGTRSSERLLSVDMDMVVLAIETASPGVVPLTTRRRGL